jgi:hypothetical protein
MEALSEELIDSDLTATDRRDRRDHRISTSLYD